jgi:hypothetical protein
MSARTPRRYSPRWRSGAVNSPTRVRACRIDKLTVVVATALLLVAAGAAAAAAPASAAVVDFPQPCPHHLRGADPLAKFCRGLAVTRRIANAKWAVYNRTQQLRIKFAVQALAARDPQFGPVMVSMSAGAASGARLISGGPQVLAFSLDLSGIRRFAVRALTVVKKAVGGVVSLTPQGRLVKCALFGALGAASTELAGGATLRSLAVNTVTGCIGALLIIKN